MLIKKLVITSFVGVTIFSLSAMEESEFSKYSKSSTDSFVGVNEKDNEFTFAQTLLIGGVLGAGLYSYVVKESGANFSPALFIVSTGIGAGSIGVCALVQEWLKNRVPVKKVIPIKANLKRGICHNELHAVVKNSNGFLLQNLE
jgi:drug/metabolite transporter (DMT)-like permease